MRFLLIGSINTAIGYSVFVTLELLVFGSVTHGYLLSLLLSYVVGIAVAYILYRRFVFVDVGPWTGSLLRFIAVYAISITINALLLVGLVSWANLQPIVAQAVALVTTVVLSYVGHRWFSFSGGVRDSERQA